MRLVFAAAAALLFVSSLSAEATLLAHWDESPEADFAAGDRCVTNATLTKDGQGLPFRDGGQQCARRLAAAEYH